MTDIKEPINTTSDGQWCVKYPKKVLLAKSWGAQPPSPPPPPQELPPCSPRRTSVEFLFAMAIPAIGNGRPKKPSARELKGAVSRGVVEVEWAKFTRFFSPR